MARRNTITARIGLEGGKEIERQLAEIGEGARRAFGRFAQSEREAAEAGSELNQRIERIRAALVRVRRAARQFGDDLQRVGDAARTTAQRTAVLVASVTAVGGALFLLARNAAQTGDNVAKMANRTGTSVRTLQELRFAASQAGVAQNQLDTGLQRFTRRVAEAANGTGEAVGALAELGVELKDASGNIRPTGDLLRDIADAFKEIEDPATRVRIAFKLFDSEGVGLVNLLRLGGDALDDFAARAQELGLVMTEQQAVIATAFVDTIDQLQRVASALQRDIGLLFAPAFTQAANAFTEAIARNREAILAFGRSIADVATPLLQDLVALIEGRDADVQATFLITLRDGITGLVSALQTLVGVVRFAFGIIRDVVQSVLDPINAVFGTDLQANVVLLTLLLGQLLGVFRLIGAIITGVRAGFALLTTIAGPAVSRFVALALAVRAGIEVIRDLIAELVEFFTGVGASVIAFFTGAADQSAAAMEQSATRSQAALDGVGTAAEGSAQRTAAAMTGAAGQTQSAFGTATGVIGSFLDSLASEAESVASQIVSAFDRIIDAASEAASAIGSAAGFSGGGAAGFAGGGRVSGPGTSRSDSIVARLSNGEYVIQARAVRKYGLGLLHALNQMRLPLDSLRGFNLGGLVDASVAAVPIMPRFADGGAVQAAPAGRPLTLNIGGEQFAGLIAPEDVADKLTRYATTSAIRRAGRLPKWYR